MRYNGFRDEIEISDSESIKNSDNILIKSFEIIPTINNETFVYIPFRINESNTIIGYLVKVYEGTKISLFLRKNIQFMDAKIARTSLENSFPTRYVQNFENYISIKGDAPVMIKNSKKSFLDLLNNRSDIKEFVKKEKIKFNKIESILKVVKFFDNN